MYQEFWDLDMCNFYEYSPALQSTALTENTYNSNFDQPAHSSNNGCYNEMSSCMYSETSSWDKNYSYGCTAQNTVSSGWNSFEENSLVAPNMMQVRTDNSYTGNLERPAHTNCSEMSTCMCSQTSDWNNSFSFGCTVQNPTTTCWKSLENSLGALNAMQIKRHENVQQMADSGQNNSAMALPMYDSTTNDLGSAQINKRKRIRTAFTTEQIQILERQFQKRPYVSRDERQVLHQKLCVSDRVIKVWFQNRRLKEKSIKEEKLAEQQETTATVNIFEGFGISLDIADEIPYINEVTPAKFSENMKYYEPISPPDCNEELVDIGSLYQPVDPEISLQSLL